MIIKVLSKFFIQINVVLLVLYLYTAVCLKVSYSNPVDKMIPMRFLTALGFM